MLSGEGFVATGIQIIGLQEMSHFFLRGNECRLVFLDYKPMRDEEVRVVRSVQSLNLEEEWQCNMLRAISELQREKRNVPIFK